MADVRQDGVARLRQHFAVRVINEAHYIVDYWFDIQQRIWCLDDARTLLQAALRLKRHADRFGQQEHLAIAGQLEEAMRQVLAVRGRLTSPMIEHLHELIQRLANTRLHFSGEQLRNTSARPDHKPLYLALADFEHARYVAQQLAFFGIHVVLFRNQEELRKAFRRRYPLALIMDVDFAGEGHGLMLAGELQGRMKTPLTVVFVSEQPADIMVRLAAVRIGGEAFLQGKLEAPALLETLDSLEQSGGVPAPSRVLIVDDSRAQAALTERALNSALITTRTVHRPILALKELDEFNPDLVILDVYMPECSGPELARMIRQCERFDSIPIIYLSGEDDLDRQLHAMKQGADDFLTKPARASTLIATVRNRVARARNLKARMVRDSLTGLYNHTHILQLLQERCTQAARSTRKHSIVMLDIDNFKVINDTHGHPVGDRVIKSLALMLRQRLRKSDLVGRYGGEEFVLVLPDTDAQQAVQITEQLRKHFMQMCFQGTGGSFGCTLSAGVVECGNQQGADSAMDWIALADRALYRAKEQGRNRVELFV